MTFFWQNPTLAIRPKTMPEERAERPEGELRREN